MPEHAITIGTLIENTEGEGHPTVSLLEAYCECIYQIYQKLEGNSKEINADKDPNCDAYVVPIPYYDKNPDGSFREVHYEGDQYPDYVPIVRYQDYDLKKRRPDKIFIHNPFDECNYVTSVHPFFYSKKLKEYTEKLVYIPYFILREIDPDNQQEVKGIEHFCLFPGFIYADKVVVQSEDMRQVYIKVLTGTFGEEIREYWAQKILGLSSPKVDKILNTRKEELTIPEEWLKIIRKPDGSWKKIIFYNTSVIALLQQNEKCWRRYRMCCRYSGRTGMRWLFCSGRIRS